jgi:CHASE1-domain containing sensor protein
MLVTIFLLFFATLSYEKNDRQQAFERQARELHSYVEKRLQANFEVLYSIRSFFNANDSVNEREFSLFAKHQLLRYPEIQALEWVPRVSREQRDEFEEKDGPGMITELGADGQVVIAAQRDEYFPVMYIEPLAGNNRAHGFDISTNVLAREAQIRALSMGGFALTAPIRLVQENGSQRGVVAYLKSNHPHAVSSMSGYGVIAGVYRMDDFVSSVMLQREDLSANVNLTILDISSDPVALYQNNDVASIDNQALA